VDWQISAWQSPKQSFEIFPLDTRNLALAPYVAKALAPLLAVFGSYEVKD
jgi:hypothetical protein